MGQAVKLDPFVNVAKQMLRDILTTSSGQQIVLLIFTKALFSSMLEYKIQINPGHFADSVEKPLRRSTLE